MRNMLCQGLANLYTTKPFVFLTGDLGFMVLEPLREVMGSHFINAGIAEQNMVSTAAGISSTGLQAWVYSIAPFIYARPFEQIRNDVCLPGADVKLVGNGGGYAYGPMGPTHHALEDYGVLLGLQNMRIYIPAFAEDLPEIISRMSTISGPNYLRLGKCERPLNGELPSYAAWRKVLPGNGTVLLVIGPLVGGILGSLMDLDFEIRPEVWVLSELPTGPDIPTELLGKLEQGRHFCIIEEHVLHGGGGQMVAYQLLKSGIRLKKFDHIFARGYPSGYYGSQAFHRKECGLDTHSIREKLGLI
jgi:transketolase